MIIGHVKVSKWFGLIGMTIWFTFVERIILKRIIELILYRKYSNPHIWIWIYVKWFKYFGQCFYWIDYCKTKLGFILNWIFLTQIMIREVIWINLNVQSVCTYQLWNFLNLWCSRWYEDSRDYKFVIFGCVEQKVWIKWCNR
jgi:hypothetical protein